MVILCGRAEQSPAPTGWGCKREIQGNKKGDTRKQQGIQRKQQGIQRKQQGDIKKQKGGCKRKREKKGKRKEKQAVSAIIRESSAFWERPKRTGVKRRVKA